MPTVLCRTPMIAWAARRTTAFVELWQVWPWNLHFDVILLNRIFHLISKARHRLRIRTGMMFRSADIAVISNRFSSRAGLKSLRFARILEPILQAPALVPLDQYSADGHSDNDLYLFAFLSGLIAASPDDFQKAVDANQPTYLTHTMPKSWTRPQSWNSLGPLALKFESDEMLSLEIGGQNSGRDFMTRKIELPPRTRLEVNGDFYSLAYIHVESKPKARLGIYSPSRKETYLIDAIAWSNIWVYGIDIFLTGWIAREEFRRRAGLIREGSRVFQYDQTRTRNLAVPISDLKPMSGLFECVRR